MVIVGSILVFSLIGFCGAVMDSSPVIDAGTLIGGMEGVLSYNGLPRIGKYPGDMPDIGAWEWFPGVNCDNPKGLWNGVPLDFNPRVVPQKPLNLRLSGE